MLSTLYLVVFFNDTATTEIYTLSLHDALPICAIASVASSARSSSTWPANRSESDPPAQTHATISGAPVNRAAATPNATGARSRSEEHTSELQSRQYLVCRLLLEKKKYHNIQKH